MKTKTSKLAIGLVTVAAFTLVACDKNESSIGSSAETSTESEIAVAASDSSAGKDSVYFHHQCGTGVERDSIAAADLPQTVTAYLEEKYPGYTFGKAFSLNDSTGTATGYVAVVYYEDAPVAIEFDSEGDFVRVLERRSGRHRKH